MARNDDHTEAVVELLDTVRGYSHGVDTTEARFWNTGDYTLGRIPVDTHSGGLLRKLRRKARKQGWATHPVNYTHDAIEVARGPTVDPVRDSTVPLSTRETDRFAKHVRTVPGDTGPLAEGSRVQVAADGPTGKLVGTEDLEPGDKVYLQYRETRRGGGYAYSPSGQEVLATVQNVADDEVDLGGDDALLLTEVYEGRAMYEASDGQHYAVKHLVRIDAEA